MGQVWIIPDKRHLIFREYMSMVENTLEAMEYGVQHSDFFELCIASQ